MLKRALTLIFYRRSEIQGQRRGPWDNLLMRRIVIGVASVFGVAGVFASSSAHGGTLVSETKSNPYPGIELIKRVESGPTNRIYVAKIALCNNYIHVAATKPATSVKTPGSWGSGIGAQFAVNGDFFAGTQVYGDAVGGGVPWPFAKTGNSQPTKWYYKRYGWIAFGKDWVEFTHTERTKLVDNNKFDIKFGFKPGEVTTEIPKGTLALVSGFPELVIEGQVYTCSSPTASTCFPDRGDMTKARYPRTAMGLTKDRKTFILVAVDGRTSSSAGMYGSELAELMGKLGAWEAFNIDGGGSTAMWFANQSYVNNASGNNFGNGIRAVANHWGVHATAAGGKSKVPGSCFVPGGCFPTPIPGAAAQVFKDMPKGSFAFDAAISLKNQKITNGCSTTPSLFCPNCGLTRAQAATFIVRAAGLDTTNPPATATFSDVAKGSSFYKFIEAAVKAGITSGCGGGKFCPADPVTRGQLAAFIRRAQGWNLLDPATPSFPVDTPKNHTFYKDIETLKDKCVFSGCGTDKFCPDDDASRGEAAVFIANAWNYDNANPCLTGSGGTGGATGSGGSAGNGASAGFAGSGLTGGAGFGAGGGAAAGGGSAATSGFGGGGNASVGPGGSEDEGGCGCRVTSSSPRGAVALLLLGLLGLRRRRG